MEGRKNFVLVWRGFFIRKARGKGLLVVGRARFGCIAEDLCWRKGLHFFGENF